MAPPEGITITDQISYVSPSNLKDGFESWVLHDAGPLSPGSAGSEWQPVVFVQDRGRGPERSATFRSDCQTCAEAVGAKVRQLAKSVSSSVSRTGMVRHSVFGVTPRNVKSSRSVMPSLLSLNRAANRPGTSLNLPQKRLSRVEGRPGATAKIGVGAPRVGAWYPTTAKRVYEAGKRSRTGA